VPLLVAGALVASGACRPGAPAMTGGAGPALLDTPWAVALGTAPTGGAAAGQVTGRAVAPHPAGGAVLAGTFAPALAVPGLAPLRSAGADDVYLARVDGAGQVRWTRRLGSTGSDGASAVAVAADGRIALAGTYAAPLELAGQVLPAAGAPAAFIALFDAGGQLQWIRALAGTGYASWADLSFAPGGALVAAGYLAGTARLGELAVSSAGETDVVVAQLAADGRPQWLRRAGGAGADAGRGVAVSADGRVAVAGAFTGQAEFGSLQLAASEDGSDGFVALFDPRGEPQWVRAIGGPSADTAARVAITGDELVAVGSFTGAALLGPLALSGRGGADGFAAALTLDGTPRWARALGGTEDDSLDAVALTAGGAVVAGGFAGAAGLTTTPLHSAGGHDIFLVALDRDGAPRWARHCGGSDEDSPGDLASTGDHLFLAGTFSRQTRFGELALHDRGDTAALLLHLAP
jgi:hypothetical protein